MNAIDLEEKLKKVPETEYGGILTLVRLLKSVFDKHRLRPNAIDCFDKAISQAQDLIAAGKDEDAWIRVLTMYRMFTTLVDAMEQTSHWSSEKVTGKPYKVPGREVRPYEGPPVEAHTKELQAIRRVFDTYVKAVLILRTMPADYAQNLGLTPSD